MPWMPEVFTAPLAQAPRPEEDAPANDAIAYYEGIMAGEPEALVRSFAARQPVLDDPRVGYVEGARRLRAFVNGTASLRPAARGPARPHHMLWDTNLLQLWRFLEVCPPRNYVTWRTKCASWPTHSALPAYILPP
jgi:hypothetical protein